MSVSDVLPAESSNNCKTWTAQACDCSQVAPIPSREALVHDIQYLDDKAIIRLTAIFATDQGYRRVSYRDYVLCMYYVHTYVS